MNKNICTKCEYSAERIKRRYTTVSETVSVLECTVWVCFVVGCDVKGETLGGGWDSCYVHVFFSTSLCVVSTAI